MEKLDNQVTLFMLICDFFSILKLLQVYELDGTRTVARMTFNSHSSTG